MFFLLLLVLLGRFCQGKATGNSYSKCLSLCTYNSCRNCCVSRMTRISLYGYEVHPIVQALSQYFLRVQQSQQALDLQSSYS